MEQIRNASVTVGTTAVLLSPELLEGQRNSVVLVNTSVGGQVVSVTWGKEAVAGQGIVLYPSGSWSESVDTAFIPSKLGIWGVASAAGATVGLQERIKV